jgi:signal transduction histidine kinase
MIGGVLLTLVVAGAGGWWIARGALRPLEAMAAEARGITERTPGSRLASPNPRDELAQLTRAFNDLLGRLEGALAQQRQFMADASHEVRTPVSIARTSIDVTLGKGGRAEDEYGDALLVVREQMRRLTRIVDDLFALSRADAAGLPLDRRPLYLDELVDDCVRQNRVLAVIEASLEKSPEDPSPRASGSTWASRGRRTSCRSSPRCSGISPATSSSGSTTAWG